MGAVLPGCYELRDADKYFWYRVIYTRIEGVIYVLHLLHEENEQDATERHQHGGQTAERLEAETREGKE
jgi:phage-related protein